MPEHESRRAALVNKLINAGLTDAEQDELDRLQKEAGKSRRRCFRINQVPPTPYNAAIDPWEGSS